MFYLLNVVMRPDRILEFIVDNHTRALRGRPSDEHHDPAAAVWIRSLK